ncbi:MAG: twin-arginine translocase TatA/TatE family subunit [Halobacteriovoraceae bacterium]|jgi:sec-independent protein translocase protein TatA|nr:twin-arginine translocase TatA/TatE family subunit [Halobacteriovoraceae bacterium]
MFGLGVGEILAILVIALIFIGPKKLPELAKGLGKGFKEFQDAMKGITNTVHNPTNNTPDIKAQEPESKVSFEEQFPDDPPHSQNKPEDEQAISQSKESESKN